jgi:hypothetical protein
MTGRKLAWSGLAAAMIAFVAQAMYESPLSVFVPYFTYVGARISWAIYKPNYSNNGSVWLFDSIAVIVNGLLYFLVIYLIDGVITRLRKRN